jgi:anti-sigma-K factor RskA
MKDDEKFADMSVPDDESPTAATPEYLGALREVAGRVPTRDVDWNEFHARLNARAELPLARLRKTDAARPPVQDRSRSRHRAPAWWEYASLPSHVWRPIAAAAAIAVAAGVHALRNDVDNAGAIDVVSLATSEFASAQGAFESAVTSGTSSGTVASYLVPASSEVTTAAGSDSSSGK